MNPATSDPRLRTDLFRETTSRMVMFNYSQRQCKGPCKRRRSVAQFIADSELCAQCRRRA